MKKGHLSQYAKLKTCFACALQEKQGVGQSYHRDVLLNIKHKNIPYLICATRIAQNAYCKDKQFWHVFDRATARKKSFRAIALRSSKRDGVQRTEMTHFPSYTKWNAGGLYQLQKRKRVFSIQNAKYPLSHSRQFSFSHLFRDSKAESAKLKSALLIACKKMAEFLPTKSSRPNSKTLWYNGAFGGQIYMKGSINFARISPKTVKDVGKLSDTSHFFRKGEGYALPSFPFTEYNAFEAESAKLISAKLIQVQRSFHAHVNRSRNSTIVRPLLDFSRTVITTICISQKIPVYPDNSNQSLLYSRNRIRKQIIPFIQLVLNPKMEEAVFRFSELAFQEKELTSKLCRQNNLCL